jgi:hypothetical protein
MDRVGVHHRIHVRARAQHLRMNEHLVVPRHRAVDLTTLEVDRDDVVRTHLLDADAGWLHQETAGIVGQADRNVARHVVALALEREHAARVGELFAQGRAHLTLP